MLLKYLAEEEPTAKEEERIPADEEEIEKLL